MSEQPVPMGGRGGSVRLNADLSGLTVVVGLGMTGLSCARFLARRGEPFVVVDSRPEPPGLEALRQVLPGVDVRLGPFDGELLEQAAQLLVSPGLSVRGPVIAQAARAGVPVLGDIELFARHARAPVIAVTGSNGKSTVTELVGQMVRDQGRQVRVGGNIGTPALDCLGPAEPDLYVLELSSFQLETTWSLDAATATVLNVSADHMDRYDCMADYLAAKERVYRGGGVMVVNRDDPRVVGMVAPGRQVFGFTLDLPRGADFGVGQQAGKAWLMGGGQRLMPRSALRMPGRHNTANALAALALGEAMGLAMPMMLDTLQHFGGLPHRCQWVARQGDVDWYNDSKGTNVGATLAAIEGLEPQGSLLLIAGGDGKGADFSPLRAAVARRVRALVLMGRDAPRIEQVMAGAVPVTHASSMAEAVDAARTLAQPGDAVLLSPACASLDMFRDYRERGDVFVAAVTGGAGD